MTSDPHWLTRPTSFWLGAALLVLAPVSYVLILFLPLPFLIAAAVFLALLLAGFLLSIVSGVAWFARAGWRARIRALTGTLVVGAGVHLLLGAPHIKSRPWQLAAIEQDGRELHLVVDEAPASLAGCSHYHGTEVNADDDSVAIRIHGNDGPRILQYLPRACGGPPESLVVVVLDKPLGQRQLVGCRPDPDDAEDFGRHVDCNEVDPDRLDDVDIPEPLETISTSTT